MAETKKPDWNEISADEEELKSNKSDKGEREGNKSGGENEVVFQRNQNTQKRPQLSKEETIEKIKTLKGTVIINLINVDYGADEESIEELYKGINIIKVEIVRKGMFSIVLPNANEALKIIEGEEKKIKGRPVKAVLGRPRRREENEREGNYNKERRPPQESNYNKKYNDSQGKYKNNYNRKDFKEEDNNEPSFPRSNYNNKPSYPKKNYESNNYNKYPNNENKNNNEEPKNEEQKPSVPKKPFGFTRGEGKKNDDQKEKPVANKSNPFGNAKARDEIKYEKKRIEENKEAAVEIKELKGEIIEKVEAPLPQKQKIVKEEEEFITVAGKKKPQENKAPANVAVESEKPKPKAKQGGNPYDQLHAEIDSDKE